MDFYVIGANGERRGPADVTTLNAWRLQGTIHAGTLIEDAETGISMRASKIEQLTFANENAPTPVAGAPEDQAEIDGNKQTATLSLELFEASRQIRIANIFSWLAIATILVSLTPLSIFIDDFFAIWPISVLTLFGLIASASGRQLIYKVERKEFSVHKLVRTINTIAIIVSCISLAVDIIGVFALIFGPGFD